MKRALFLLTLGAVLLAPAFTGVRASAAPGEAASLSRLARVGRRMVSAARRVYPNFRPQRGRFQFSVNKSRDLNAAAYPDGRVVVTRGMMQALANRPDDELAAVIGHEITHIAEKHQARTQRTAVAGAIVGAVVGRVIGKGRAGATEAGAALGAALSAAAYSRHDEYRADAGSVRLLAQAGYDPYAMMRVLEMLKRKSGRGSAGKPLIGWFASHPDTAKRVQRAKREADKIVRARRRVGGKRPRPSHRLHR